jgi:nitrate reductase delta subunit
MNRELLKLVAELLKYPEVWWNKLNVLLNMNLPEQIKEFLDKVRRYELLDLNEEYVNTFDLDKNTTLNMTYYLAGERPERGKYLLKLMEKIGKPNKELPDYLPYVIERIVEYPDPEIISLLKLPLEILMHNLQKRNSIFLSLIKFIYLEIYGDGSP